MVDPLPPIKGVELNVGDVLLGMIFLFSMMYLLAMGFFETVVWVIYGSFWNESLVRSVAFSGELMIVSGLLWLAWIWIVSRSR